MPRPPSLVDPYAPLWLRVLGISFPTLGALLCIAALLPSPRTAGRTFAWDTNPVTALTLSFFFLGVLGIGLVTLRSPSWLRLRAHLLSLAVFLTITLLGAILYRDSLAGPGAPWPARALSLIWIPALTADLLGVAAAAAIWRWRRPPQPARPTLVVKVRRPYPIRVALICMGVTGLVMGVLVMLDAEAGIPIWPWTVSRLDAYVLGGAAFSLAVGAISGVAATDSRQLGSFAIMLMTASFGSLVGTFLYGGLRPGPLAGMYVAVTAAAFTLSTVLFLGERYLYE